MGGKFAINFIKFLVDAIISVSATVLLGNDIVNYFVALISEMTKPTKEAMVVPIPIISPVVNSFFGLIGTYTCDPALILG